MPKYSIEGLCEHLCQEKGTCGRQVKAFQTAQRMRWNGYYQVSEEVSETVNHKPSQSEMIDRGYWGRNSGGPQDWLRPEIRRCKGRLRGSQRVGEMLKQQELCDSCVAGPARRFKFKKPPILTIPT